MLPNDWLDKSLSEIPSKFAIRDRNAAISAIYAQLYLLNPILFCWSGLAAFASFRVGLMLALYDFAYVKTTAPAVTEMLLDDSALLKSFELIRMTNNDIFRSAGVAHLAYAARGGGLDGVRQMQDKHPDIALPVDGLTLIESAQNWLNAGEKKKAERDAWKATRALADHEQRVTAEKHFKEASFQLGVFMSLGTSLDFDGNHLTRDAKTHTSFSRHMWTRGLWTIAKSLAFPDITLLAHRWEWVSNGVLPAWKRTAWKDSELSNKLERIIERARPVFDAVAYFRTLDIPLNNTTSAIAGSKINLGNPSTSLGIANRRP